MIQPFITMKSLSTGIMDDAVLARFAIERQKKFSI